MVNCDCEVKKLLLPPENPVNLHFFRTVNVSEKVEVAQTLLLSLSHIERIAITLWCSSVPPLLVKVKVRAEVAYCGLFVPAVRWDVCGGSVKVMRLAL